MINETSCTNPRNSEQVPSNLFDRLTHGSFANKRVAGEGIIRFEAICCYSSMLLKVLFSS